MKIKLINKFHKTEADVFVDCLENCNIGFDLTIGQINKARRKLCPSELKCSCGHVFNVEGYIVEKKYQGATFYNIEGLKKMMDDYKECLDENNRRKNETENLINMNGFMYSIISTKLAIFLKDINTELERNYMQKKDIRGLLDIVIFMSASLRKELEENDKNKNTN